MFRPRGNSNFQQPHGSSPTSPHHDGGFGPRGGPQGPPGTSPLAGARFGPTSPQTAAFQQQQLMATVFQQHQFNNYHQQQQQFTPQMGQQFKQQRFQTPPSRQSPYGQRQQSPRGGSWRGETPRGRAGWQQGSPRMAGFRSPWHGRADREASVDCYYKKSMVQDPWRGLVPVSVSDMESSRDREASGRHTGRYFGRVPA